MSELLARDVPADLPEKIWEIFAHGGNFEATDQAWAITGLEDVPAGLLMTLESPDYAPHVLEAAAHEKRLNNEAETLHEQLYGNLYYPPAMYHQLLKRYQEIGAKNRIRGRYPYKVHPGLTERSN